ncbi:NAD(P)/FAD-dependent oxidoreductase [Deinococcus radiophilus]|uniref:NAD(P)/FAD-dependent oxidoreductase n=1 Tax=Deinococcus radiophilus TaxID=32062 RepID=UPI001E56DE26|nr:FAD-dependent oxidoreductase [Deinococcus radiophilus]UFA51732.1 FAD-binding oxidoreductase [Deinococcus radiophilus]
MVGAGLIGSAVAWQLTQAGAEVLVLDAGRAGAAWKAGAGMLSPQGERLAGTPLEQDAQTSLSLWPEFAHRLSKGAGWTVPLTFGVEHLQPDRSVYVCPHEARTCPPLVVAAARTGLNLRCAEVQRLLPVRGGVRVCTSEGEFCADQVVLACGVWTRAFGVKVAAVRGQAVLLQTQPGAPARFAPPGGGHARYGLGRPDGLYIGATARATDSHRPSVRERGWLLGVASELFADQAWPQCWARDLVGLRPVNPFGPPLVAPHPTLPRVTVATGHGRHGALLAPLTARRVAELVL